MSNTINTMEEAIAYLQPIADSATAMPNYSKALMIAIGAMERVPVLERLLQTQREQIHKLEAALRDERDRHDKYVDYAMERDRMIDQMKKEAERMNTVLRLCFREDPCLYCRWGKEPVPCQGADYICDECTHEGCVCHACRDFDKWEMERDEGSGEWLS